MSTNYLNRPEISREVIEAALKRARVDVQTRCGSLLGQVFSRPEHKADEADIHHAAKTGFRLG